MDLLLLLFSSSLVVQASSKQKQQRRRRQRQRQQQQQRNHFCIICDIIICFIIVLVVVLSIISTTTLSSSLLFTVHRNDDRYFKIIHPNDGIMIHAYTINNPISRHTTTTTRIKFDKFAKQHPQLNYDNKLQQIQHFKRIFSSTIQLWGKVQQKTDEDEESDDKMNNNFIIGSNENDDNDDSTRVVSDNGVDTMTINDDAKKIPKRKTIVSKKSTGSTTTKSTKKSSKKQTQTKTAVSVVSIDNIIQNSNSNSEDSKIVQEESEDDYDTIYAEIPGSDEYDRIAYDNDNTDLEDRINTMTFVQLQQQLRLRGKKISGQNKQVLINRLLGRTTIVTTGATSIQTDNESTASTTPQSTENTVQPVDVSEFLDDVDDIGKDMKTFTTTSNRPDLDPNYADSTNPISNNPEVWGTDALLVDTKKNNNDDMEQIIVDNLSRSTIDFVGSNETITKAYVVASYDSLKQYIQGGSINNQNRLQNQQKDTQQSLEDDETSTSTTGSDNKNRQSIIQTAEQTIKEIQIQREENDKQVRPVRFDDPMSISTSSIDIDDENRIITDVVLHRDYSDWGKYSVTGQQISSSYITGVLLLSDIYGYNTKDTRILAETIAFECQPIIVMVPDLFNSIPWKPVSLKNNDDTTIQRNELGQTIEEWRNTIHDEVRVSITIRAAAQCLREQYGCTSIVIFGTCYGGGRAIEIAANYIPNSIYDIDKSTINSYPVVNPSAVIAWYPTRYEQSLSYLFGPNRQTTNIINSDTTFNNNPTTGRTTSNTNTVAVMCIFAENDTIPGATKADAEELQSLLEHDDRIKDYIVKIFPEQQHGFAHVGISNRRSGGSSGSGNGDSDLQFLDNEFGGSGSLSLYNDDADIAFLLSTSFMETYSRIFLPTVGVPIRYDDSTSTGSSTESSTSQWNSASGILLDKSYSNNNRNIREEIDSAINNYVDTPLDDGITVSGEKEEAVVVKNRMIDPTDPTMEDELIQLLRTMESPEQANGGKYKILDDDDLPTIYAKLTTADPDFQIF